MIRPDHSAQMRAPVLDVWASLYGYAVGIVGGTVREAIEEYPTLDAAFAAYRAAREGAAAVAMVRAVTPRLGR